MAGLGVQGCQLGAPAGAPLLAQLGQAYPGPDRLLPACSPARCRGTPFDPPWGACVASGGLWGCLRTRGGRARGGGAVPGPAYGGKGAKCGCIKGVKTLCEKTEKSLDVPSNRARSRTLACSCKSPFSTFLPILLAGLSGPSATSKQPAAWGEWVRLNGLFKGVKNR